MGHFHKALPNVKSAHVTLQNFTPDLQKIYTDISAVSVTLCNSASRDGFGDIAVGAPGKYFDGLPEKNYLIIMMVMENGDGGDPDS